MAASSLKEIEVRGETTWYGNLSECPSDFELVNMQLAEMLRYDSGTLKDVRAQSRDDNPRIIRLSYLALVQAKRYTETRWASFGFKTALVRELHNTGRYVKTTTFVPRAVVSVLVGKNPRALAEGETFLVKAEYQRNGEGWFFLEDANGDTYEAPESFFKRTRKPAGLE